MASLEDIEHFPWLKAHKHDEQEGLLQHEDVGWRRILDLFSTSDLEKMPLTNMPRWGFLGRLAYFVRQPTPLSKTVEPPISCHSTDDNHV